MHASNEAKNNEKEGFRLASNPVVWTLGHSNKDIGEFLKLLTGANIQTVVDCRSKPRSRWYQFNQTMINSYLEAKGILYEFRGGNLGGLSGNVYFDETLDELRARAVGGERIALMCSEGDPKKCHRGTVLAPELNNRGIKVEHLLYVKVRSGSEQLRVDW